VLQVAGGSIKQFIHAFRSFSFPQQQLHFCEGLEQLNTSSLSKNLPLLAGFVG
jgi:hypothetical protein